MLLYKEHDDASVAISRSLFEYSLKRIANLCLKSTESVARLHLQLFIGDFIHKIRVEFVGKYPYSKVTSIPPLFSLNL